MKPGDKCPDCVKEGQGGTMIRINDNGRQILICSARGFGHTWIDLSPKKAINTPAIST